MTTCEWLLRRLLLLLVGCATASDAFWTTSAVGQQVHPEVVIDNVAGGDRPFFLEVDESTLRRLPALEKEPARDSKTKRDLIVGRGTRFQLADFSLDASMSPLDDPKTPGRFQTVYDQEHKSSFTVNYVDRASPRIVNAPPKPAAFQTKAPESGNYLVAFLVGRLQGGEIPSKAWLMTADRIKVIPGEYHDAFGDWVLTMQTTTEQADLVTVTLTKRGEKDASGSDLRVGTDPKSTMRQPGEVWEDNFGGKVSLATWQETLQLSIGTKARRVEQIIHNLEVQAANGKSYKESTTYEVKTCLTEPVEVDKELERVVVPIPSGFVVHVMGSRINKMWVDGTIVDRIDRKALREREVAFQPGNSRAQILMIIGPLVAAVLLVFVGYRMYRVLRRKGSKSLAEKGIRPTKTPKDQGV